MHARPDYRGLANDWLWLGLLPTWLTVAIVGLLFPDSFGFLASSALPVSGLATLTIAIAAQSVRPKKWHSRSSYSRLRRQLSRGYIAIASPMLLLSVLHEAGLFVVEGFRADRLLMLSLVAALAAFVTAVIFLEPERSR